MYKSAHSAINAARNAVHMHLKEKNHSFEDTNLNILAKKIVGYEEE